MTADKCRYSYDVFRFHFHNKINILLLTVGGFINLDTRASHRSKLTKNVEFSSGHTISVSFFKINVVLYIKNNVVHNLHHVHYVLERAEIVLCYLLI